MYIDYYKYIKSEDWRKVRNKYISKHKVCECCLYNKPQCVHHEWYDKLWKEKSKNLRALCNDCHKKIHKIYNEWRSMNRNNLRTSFRILKREYKIKNWYIFSVKSIKPEYKFDKKL